MDDDTLKAVFEGQTAGSKILSRRMVINIADFFGERPKTVVHRLERLGLCKLGSWDWFTMNGGITREHIEEARADRAVGVN